MSPFSAVILLVDQIPRQLLREPSATRPDYLLVADKLAHCERQVRALGELAPAPEAVVRLMNREGDVSTSPSVRRASR